jgi:hypothetical protein
MTYIYLVEIGNNQVYIGKTKNPKQRKNNHKKTYGKNIEYNIIDQVNSLNRKDWEPIETMWIQTFISWGFEVVNPRKKGGGGCEYWTEEQKQAKSLQSKQMWINRTEEEKQLVALSQSKGKKGTNGFPKGQSKSLETKEKMKGKNGYPKGRPRTEEEKLKMKKPHIGSGPKGPRPDNVKQQISQKNSKPISQYDLDGNFIKEWPSRVEAKKWLGGGDIAGCLKGKQKTAGGYFWKYKK